MDTNVRQGTLLRTPKDYNSELYLVLETEWGEPRECVYGAMNANPESPDFGKTVDWDVKNSTRGFDCVNHSRVIAQYDFKNFKELFADPDAARMEIKELLYRNLDVSGLMSIDFLYDMDFDAVKEDIKDALYKNFMKTIGKQE